MLTLYTFRISHFAEKARWALDLEGLPYEERTLLPGAHIPVVRRRAPANTVPLLGHDGTFVQGSSAILDYLEARLGASRIAPAAAQKTRANELEALADRAFGRGVQQIGYDALLGDRDAVIDLWAQGGPRWAPFVYRRVYPFMAKAIMKTYRIVPEVVAEAKERLLRAFDETDRILERQRFLLGDDRPTRVDVAVASLLAPILRPAEHVVRWGPLDPKTAALLREIDPRPTAAFVRRMYAEHRR